MADVSTTQEDRPHPDILEQGDHLPIDSQIQEDRSPLSSPIRQRPAFSTHRNTHIRSSLDPHREATHNQATRLDIDKGDLDYLEMKNATSAERRVTLNENATFVQFLTD